MDEYMLYVLMANESIVFNCTASGGQMVEVQEEASCGHLLRWALVYNNSPLAGARTVTAHSCYGWIQYRWIDGRDSG